MGESSDRWLMLSTPAGAPGLWARAIVDPLVLDPPREPIKRGRARLILRWVLGQFDCSRNHWAVLDQSVEQDGVAWPGEEYQGPSLVFSLVPWRSTLRKSALESAGNLFDRPTQHDVNLIAICRH